MNKFKRLEKSLRKELERTGTVIKEENNTTRYRTILYEGYLGDFATEWWTQKDWEEHEKRVVELKRKGIYGKPWICDLTIKNFPEFDNPTRLSNKSTESYRFTIIDFSK